MNPIMHNGRFRNFERFREMKYDLVRHNILKKMSKNFELQLNSKRIKSLPVCIFYTNPIIITNVNVLCIFMWI